MPRELEPEGAWAALETKNIFLTLKSLPAPSRAGCRRPDGPKLQLDLSRPGTAGPPPGTQVDRAEPSETEDEGGSGHLAPWGEAAAPATAGCLPQLPGGRPPAPLGGLQGLPPTHGRQRAQWSSATHPRAIQGGHEKATLILKG